MLLLKGSSESLLQTLGPGESSLNEIIILKMRKKMRLDWKIFQTELNKN